MRGRFSYDSFSRELENALETKTQTMQYLEAQREVKYHRPITHGNTDRLRIDDFIDLVAEIREKSDRILEDVSSSRVAPSSGAPSPISEVSTGRPSSGSQSQHSVCSSLSLSLFQTYRGLSVSQKLTPYTHLLSGLMYHLLPRPPSYPDHLHPRYMRKSCGQFD